MNKIAVIYWSGTGNTKIMADAVAEGIRESGDECHIFTPDNFSIDKVNEFDAIAFGCPSMGAEELEDSEFEPLFSKCESLIKEKIIVLFGSYGWGDGEWMRNWKDRCIEDGAIVVSEPVICSGEPTDDIIIQCKNLGASLLS